VQCNATRRFGSIPGEPQTSRGWDIRCWKSREDCSLCHRIMVLRVSVEMRADKISSRGQRLLTGDRTDLDHALNRIR